MKMHLQQEHSTDLAILTGRPWNYSTACPKVMGRSADLSLVVAYNALPHISFKGSTTLQGKPAHKTALVVSTTDISQVPHGDGVSQGRHWSLEDAREED